MTLDLTNRISQAMAHTMMMFCDVSLVYDLNSASVINDGNETSTSDY